MWIQYAILTIILWGTADLFYKKGNASDERFTHLKTIVMVGITLFAMSIFEWIKVGFRYDVSKVIEYLPVTLLYILSMGVGYFGLRYLELSISSPIGNASGLAAALMSFIFLGKNMGASEWCFVIALTVGIFLLERFEEPIEYALDPQDPENKKYISSKFAIIFPILYMIIDTTATFLDGYYLEGTETTAPLLTESESIITYGITFFIVGLIALGYMRYKGERLVIRKEKNRFLAAVFEAAGQYAYTYALASNAIMSAPVVSAYCVVSVLLGRFLLKEKLTWKQYVVIAVMIFSIVGLEIVGGGE